jgi:hypothetical protein
MENIQAAIVNGINKDFNLQLEENTEAASLLIMLSQIINEMILKDFERLVNLLYRIDVNEKKLKAILSQQTNTEAGKIIAALIIERQSEKIKSRESTYKKESDISDEEKW